MSVKLTSGLEILFLVNYLIKILEILKQVFVRFSKAWSYVINRCTKRDHLMPFKIKSHSVFQNHHSRYF